MQLLIDLPVKKFVKICLQVFKALHGETQTGMAKLIDDFLHFFHQESNVEGIMLFETVQLHKNKSKSKITNTLIPRTLFGHDVSMAHG